ncbi:hypothetical protein GOBAR_AA15208 [Gossypium barbadense]|uniref:Uncharacterized protein n=1 Tax=Gossypium barbadense TaxID=3634 RepID=A0A2P5XQ34_GOSBA|nr:hypothetical protein GOBAR_AA15208 [Gossypium barbadense]
MNATLLAKLRWELENGDSTLWARVLRSKYLNGERDPNFWTASSDVMQLVLDADVIRKLRCKCFKIAPCLKHYSHIIYAKADFMWPGNTSHLIATSIGNFNSYKVNLQLPNRHVNYLIAWSQLPPRFVKMNVDVVATLNLGDLPIGGLCWDNIGLAYLALLGS